MKRNDRIISVIDLLISIIIGILIWQGTNPSYRLILRRNRLQVALLLAGVMIFKNIITILFSKNKQKKMPIVLSLIMLVLSITVLSLISGLPKKEYTMEWEGIKLYGYEVKGDVKDAITVDFYIAGEQEAEILPFPLFKRYYPKSLEDDLQKSLKYYYAQNSYINVNKGSLPPVSQVPELTNSLLKKDDLGRIKAEISFKGKNYAFTIKDVAMHSELIEVFESDGSDNWKAIVQMPLTQEIYSVQSSDSFVFISYGPQNGIATLIMTENFDNFYPVHLEYHGDHEVYLESVQEKEGVLTLTMSGPNWNPTETKSIYKSYDGGKTWSVISQ